MSDGYLDECSVKSVVTRGDLKEFLNLPDEVYVSHPLWVRPLNMVVSDYLDQKRNPFYADGKGEAFLVQRKGRILGRVLCTVWSRHERLHSEKVAYFGYLECLEDRSAFTSLIRSIEEYARVNGCGRIRGPFNTTAAQEMGFLTKGYENVPAIDMVYSAPWYPEFMREGCFEPCLSMSTWRNHDISRIDENEMVTEETGRILKERSVTIRTVSKKARGRDFELIRELVNASFLGNWSFVPISHEEWRLQVGEMSLLFDPDLILIAEVQGVPVGVTFAAPDFNRLLKGMRGRLAHPRAIRLLDRSFFRDAVVILFAVRKQYQGLGISKALNAKLVKTLKQKGYRTLSITWIADGNIASLAQARGLKMEKIHELAMYEKVLPC